MSGRSDVAVERWTRASIVSGFVVAVVIVGLTLVPLAAGANVIDKLTTLFVYIILAAMWNALAGYAGLVSVGQQAFFGIGAYFAIQFSVHGVPAYPSLVLGAVAGAALAAPISYFMLRLHGGEFSIGMWVVAEALHLMVNQDKLVQGETGTSMIALNAYSHAERLAYNYWLALGTTVVLLGAVFVLLRSPLGASVQAIRDDEDAAASLGVRVLAAKRTIFILAAFGCAMAGVVWLSTSVTFQPKTNFGVQWTAYMILMALVGGLGTFEELFEVVTWAQLGFHRKNIGLLNVEGYFDPLVNLIDHAIQTGFIKATHRELVVMEREPAALLDRLATHQLPHVRRWLGPEEI